jgi:hypothetical protein
MAAHYHIALGSTRTDNGYHKSGTTIPRLEALKSMRGNRHHYSRKSLDSS